MRLPKTCPRGSGTEPLDTFFSLLSSPEKDEVPRAEDIQCRKEHKEHSVKVKPSGNIDLDKVKVISMSRRCDPDEFAAAETPPLTKEPKAVLLCQIRFLALGFVIDGQPDTRIKTPSGTKKFVQMTGLSETWTMTI